MQNFSKIGRTVQAREDQADPAWGKKTPWGINSSFRALMSNFLIFAEFWRDLEFSIKAYVWICFLIHFLIFWLFKKEELLFCSFFDMNYRSLSFFNRKYGEVCSIKYIYVLVACFHIFLAKKNTLTRFSWLSLSLDGQIRIVLSSLYQS